jgi:hypothetical protein
MGGRETRAESSGAEAPILAELNVGAKAPSPKEKAKSPQAQAAWGTTFPHAKE